MRKPASPLFRAGSSPCLSSPLPLRRPADCDDGMASSNGERHPQERRHGIYSNSGRNVSIWAWVPVTSRRRGTNIRTRFTFPHHSICEVTQVQRQPVAGHNSYSHQLKTSWGSIIRQSDRFVADGNPVTVSRQKHRGPRDSRSFEVSLPACDTATATTPTSKRCNEYRRLRRGCLLSTNEQHSHIVKYARA